MKFFIVLLVVSNLYAVVPNQFNSGDSIIAEQLNENFDALSSILSSKGIIVSFNSYTKGDTILESSITNNFGMLEGISSEYVFNKILTSPVISSSNINQLFNEAEVFSNNAIKNNWGDSSDGSVTLSENTELTVPNKNGLYDGDMVVKQYSSLSIDEGVILTVDHPNRGLLIYVDGTLTLNGKISMTARGANTPNINAEVNIEGLLFRRFTNSGTDSNSELNPIRGTGSISEGIESSQSFIDGNGSIFYIQREGTAGGIGWSHTAHTYTNALDGVLGQSGGGGLGWGADASGGDGTAGTCFSGGSGAGGDMNTYSAVKYANAAPYGGQGGNSHYSAAPNWCIGGGAGNPGGNFNLPSLGICTLDSYGSDGTGGTLIIIAKEINIGATGIIESKGSDGGIGSYMNGAGSGGGAILILHGQSFINNGSISTEGGQGLPLPNLNGKGGAGSVQIHEVLN